MMVRTKFLNSFINTNDGLVIYLFYQTKNRISIIKRCEMIMECKDGVIS